MRRNEREGEKGRDMEEEGKNREGEWWEIRIKMLYLCHFFLGIVTFVNCLGIVNGNPLFYYYKDCPIAVGVENHTNFGCAASLATLDKL
jgi:hypothetical protein